METTTTMTDVQFVITDEWLERFKPGRGSSWTQSMLEVIDPDAWPRGRQSPVAGWRDRVRGKVITHAQRQAFEAAVRASLQGEVRWHATALEDAKRRLATLDMPSMLERPELSDWTSWETAPGVM